MSLTDRFPHTSLCSGDAAEFADLSSVQDLIEGFLRSSLPLIVPNLLGIRPGKKRNEKAIAADLCKDLNTEASNQLFYFFPEAPQNDSVTRTLDMEVYPRPAVVVAGRIFGGRDCLYGIEAKLLPAPHTSMEDRSREYVVGRWESKDLPHKSKKGGIERFKELHHGPHLDRAAMIGFVRSHNFNHWHSKVNLWIDELIATPIPSHDAIWRNQDRLTDTTPPGPTVAEYHSNHVRADHRMIDLTHFWLDLTDQAAPKPEADKTSEKES